MEHTKHTPSYPMISSDVMEELARLRAELERMKQQRDDLLEAAQAIWSSNRLDKSIALGNLDHQGEKIGPYCSDMTEMVWSAIANATNNA